MSSSAPECDFSDPLSVNACLLRTDITLEQSQEIYRQWAVTGTYDKDISDIKKYGALQQLVKAVTDNISDKNSLILDCGAGTGLSGKVLQDEGYTRLHALEPLKEFVDVLKSKQIYSNILPEFIGGGHKVSAADNTYDAIVSSGMFGPGHNPADSVLEMERVVKPGGHVITVMREEYLWTVPDYKENLQRLWDKLEADGKWKLVSRITYPNHFAGKNGLVIIFQCL